MRLDNGAGCGELLRGLWVKSMVCMVGEHFSGLWMGALSDDSPPAEINLLSETTNKVAMYISRYLPPRHLARYMLMVFCNATSLEQ